MSRRSGYNSDIVSRILRTTSFVEANLSKALTIQDLADVACYSLFHFCRLFNSVAGMSPYDYIMRRRLSRAAVTVVDDRDKSVIEIAFDTGFKSPDGFTRAFRRMFGMTPTDVRRTGFDGRRLLASLDATRIEVLTACKPVGSVCIEEDIVVGVKTVVFERAATAIQRIGCSIESGEGWFGAHYATDRLAREPSSEPRVQVFFAPGTERDQACRRFRTTIPAGDYQGIDFSEAVDKFVLIEELVFSTFWPRLRRTEMPNELFGARNGANIRILVPEK
jgi:AraC-like DNA-binding protein